MPVFIFIFSIQNLAILYKRDSGLDLHQPTTLWTWWRFERNWTISVTETLFKPRSLQFHSMRSRIERERDRERRRAAVECFCAWAVLAVMLSLPRSCHFLMESNCGFPVSIPGLRPTTWRRQLPQRGRHFSALFTEKTTCTEQIGLLTRDLIAYLHVEFKNQIACM